METIEPGKIRSGNPLVKVYNKNPAENLIKRKTYYLKYKVYQLKKKINSSKEIIKNRSFPLLHQRKYNDHGLQKNNH